MPPQREPIVRVVNRVVGEDGKLVPYEYFFDGMAGWIHDHLDLPVGEARTIIHQSMYRMDPVTHQPDYKLGCEALGADEAPVPVAETQRNELIDRSLLPPDRQIGARDRFGRRLQQVRIHNPITPRRDASAIGPRPTEMGVHPGEFGDRL